MLLVVFSVAHMDKMSQISALQLCVKPMRACVRMCVRARASVCMFVCARQCVCAHARACACVCVYVCVYVFAYVSLIVVISDQALEWKC